MNLMLKFQGTRVKSIKFILHFHDVPAIYIII